MSEAAELLGFLSVVEHVKFGLIGGYLVLNKAGRPVEFHCTTPVRTTRPQEILYGDSLAPFIYGEQIGQTLVGKSRSETALVFTNAIPVLALQEFTDKPVIYVTLSPKKTDAATNNAANNRETLPLLSYENDNGNNSGNKTNNESLVSVRLHNIPGLCVDNWEEIEIGHKLLALPGHLKITREQQREKLTVLMKTLDFLEPFERIRLALEETQRAA
ncbi:MAG: hypothetical protein LBU65_01455 [Planctomycetaceae bacterium]|jgi:hypothetical protein|nr:hypothetical protein [Planctomycetaceae bacterium]